MTNIPTDLLRTLIAVVDLRSFTKAAQSLGVTQPAVSAQIKRLQGLLGTDLLDKSAPGVSLTSAGELVVNYARRLLSINDQILDLAAPRANARDDAHRRHRRLRRRRHLARPGLLAHAAVRICASWCPTLRSMRCCATCAKASSTLRSGCPAPARRSTPGTTGPRKWSGCARRRRGSTPTRPVPLVSYGEDCVFTRNACETLSRAGRDCELAFVGSSVLGLAAAVTAGFGVMALSRSRADLAGVSVWEDAPLPKLPDIYLRHLCARRRRAGGSRAGRRDARRGAAAGQPDGRDQSAGHQPQAASDLIL